MLKILRADFYKIVKSKTLLILLIFTLLTALTPSIAMLINSSTSTVLDLLYRQTMTASFMWIFIVPFVCKDFSSSYVKNLMPSYTQKDKVYYILSKLIYIFVFCVLYSIAAFIFTTILNYAFGSGTIHDEKYEAFTLGGFALNQFAEVLNSVAIGAFIMFLCMVLKKDYFVLVIIVSYMFIFSSMIYNAIDNAILKATGDFFNYTKLYTLFGPSTATLDYNELPIVIGMSLLYTAVFSALSWLVFRKRSY